MTVIDWMKSGLKIRFVKAEITTLCCPYCKYKIRERNGSSVPSDAMRRQMNTHILMRHPFKVSKHI